MSKGRKMVNQKKCSCSKSNSTHADSLAVNFNAVKTRRSKARAFSTVNAPECMWLLSLHQNKNACL